jgi:hypothetical protein
VEGLGRGGEGAGEDGESVGEGGWWVMAWKGPIAGVA